MDNKDIEGSLSGIVDKMNKTYDGLLGEGFNLCLDRRIIPVMVDGVVSGWKMQRCEDDIWVDMEDGPFETMEALMAFYKSKE